MKYTFTLCLTIVYLCVPARLPAQAATPAPPPPEPALQQVVQQVQAKASAGKRAEADYADEVKTLDALIAANPDPKSDAAVHAAYLKAMLYLEVIQDRAKAAEALGFVATNYPETDYGHNALGMIEKIATSAADLPTVQAAGDVLTAIATHYPNTQYGQFAAATLDKVNAIVASKKIQDALVVGTVFPDFMATNLEGAPFSVGAYKGKVVLLDFWATWCPVCVAELPNLIESYKKHHGDGFEILGINLDTERGKLTQFLKANKDMTWPQAFNAQDLATKYGTYQIPFSVLIGPNGKILAKELRGPEVEMAVAEAMAMK